jgi:hypothetical protein
MKDKEVHMSYRLKKSELAFQVTREGKFAYRRYKHGETYSEVPPEDAHRFENTGTGTKKEEDPAPRRRGDTVKK